MCVAMVLYDRTRNWSHSKTTWLSPSAHDLPDSIRRQRTTLLGQGRRILILSDSGSEDDTQVFGAPACLVFLGDNTGSLRKGGGSVQ